MIRRYPNVGTHHKLCYGIIAGIHTVMRGTRGTETSKYPEEKKIIMITKVVASEIVRAQT